ncbi:unnamed protein product [Paramecium sonneborni]|uniref:Uncharacterized protein n=1 Tax=Paramecium sonneborni TaxID=65129 RepID=A0A8S1R2V5_9CILI|nr:unnamed protein product [Paramecium sonneborni]
MQTSSGCISDQRAHSFTPNNIIHTKRKMGVGDEQNQWICNFRCKVWKESSHKVQQNLDPKMRGNFQLKGIYPEHVFKNKAVSIPSGTEKDELQIFYNIYYAIKQFSYYFAKEWQIRRKTTTTVKLIKQTQERSLNTITIQKLKNQNNYFQQKEQIHLWKKLQRMNFKLVWSQLLIIY